MRVLRAPQVGRSILPLIAECVVHQASKAVRMMEAEPAVMMMLWAMDRPPGAPLKAERGLRMLLRAFV